MKRVFFAIALLSAPVPGMAEEFAIASKSRTALLKNQIDILEGRAAQQYSNAVRLDAPGTYIPPGPDAIAALDLPASPYLDTARRAAARHRVPEPLFLALITRESAWNARARSHKGAYGLAQLMPSTARLLRVDAADPADNIDGGARYLRMMYNRFGNWPLALAAYNAGPEAVEAYGGIPPYAETQAYVRAIMAAF